MCKSENVPMLLTTSVNVAVPNLPSDAFALTRFFLNVQICNYADAPMIFLLFLKNYYSVITFPFSDWERKGINHSLLRKMFFEDLFSPTVKPTSSNHFITLFNQELYLRTSLSFVSFETGCKDTVRYFLNQMFWRNNHILFLLKHRLLKSFSDKGGQR